MCLPKLSNFHVAIHKKKKFIPKKMLIQRIWIMPFSAQEDKQRWLEGGWFQSELEQSFKLVISLFFAKWVFQEMVRLTNCNKTDILYPVI